MKLSVSISDEDVEFLDGYARARGIPSRSAAVQAAIRHLRGVELAPAYEDAWAEWDEHEADTWDAVAGDGI